MILGLIGAAHGFLISLMLLITSKKIPLRVYLALFLLCLSLVLSGSLLLSSTMATQFPHLAYLHSPFTYMVFPLLYFYIRASSKSEKLPFWPHSILFFASILHHLPIYFLNTSEKIGYIQSAGIELPMHRSVFFWTVILQAIVYLSLSINRLRNQQHIINRKLFIFSSAFVLLMILLVLMGVVRKFTFYSYDQSYLPAAITLIWVIYAYFHFFNPNFSDFKTPQSKYGKSGLSKLQSEHYLKAFIDFIESGNSYLNPGLTLAEVSTALGINPNYLSQSINQNLNQTFTEVLNEYRVKEAIQMMHNRKYDHYSIDGISQEVGFKSKSAFYSNFKKLTGGNPKELRKGLK